MRLFGFDISENPFNLLIIFGSSVRNEKNLVNHRMIWFDILAIPQCFSH